MNCRDVVSLALVASLGSAVTGCADTESLVTVESGGVAMTLPSSGCTGTEGVKVRGLVYTVPLETRQLPDFGTMRPIGMVCTDALAVTERRGYPGFPGVRGSSEWFAIDFQGSFVVKKPGWFHFRLTSDDGSKLFIDGARVLDNDGYHATRATEGAAYLTAGEHAIAIPYWQGPGPLALTLDVARPGEDYATFRFDQPLEGTASDGPS